MRLSFFRARAIAEEICCNVSRYWFLEGPDFAGTFSMIGFWAKNQKTMGNLMSKIPLQNWLSPFKWWRKLVVRYKPLTGEIAVRVKRTVSSIAAVGSYLWRWEKNNKEKKYTVTHRSTRIERWSIPWPLQDFAGDTHPRSFDIRLPIGSWFLVFSFWIRPPTAGTSCNSPRNIKTIPNRCTALSTHLFSNLDRT